MTGQKKFWEKINFSSQKLGTKILKRFLATLVQRCTVFDHEGFKYYLTLFSRFGERQPIFSHKQVPGGGTRNGNAGISTEVFYNVAFVCGNKHNRTSFMLVNSHLASNITKFAGFIFVASFIL